MRYEPCDLEETSALTVLINLTSLCVAVHSVLSGTATGQARLCPGELFHPGAVRVPGSADSQFRLLHYWRGSESIIQ